MCNSGSSALYLAVEVLGLEPGDEIVTSAVTFSTDIAPMVRAGLVPAFVDVTPDTFQIDVDAHRGDDRPAHQGDPRPEPHRQRARLGPHPRDRRPPRPAGRRGLVRRARPHAAGHADRHPRRHQPHELRPVAHHHRRGHRRDGVLRRRRARRPGAAAPPLGPPLRGAAVRLEEGRRARGSSAPSTATSSTTTCSSSTRWGGTSSRRSCPPPSGSCSSTSSARTSPAGSATSSSPARTSPAGPDLFTLPRAHRRRRDRLAHVPACSSTPTRASGGPSSSSGWSRHGVDTRMVWTGNATRQPAFRDRPHRVPAGGLPNADRVMEWGLVLPNNHSMTDDDCALHRRVPRRVRRRQGARMTDAAALRRAARPRHRCQPRHRRRHRRAARRRGRRRGRSPPAPLDAHDHLAGRARRDARSACARYGTTVGHRRRRPHRRGRSARASSPRPSTRSADPIEILVNNAAAAIYMPLAELPAEAPAHHVRGQRPRAARPRPGRRPGDARRGRGLDRQRLERQPPGPGPGRRSTLGATGHDDRRLRRVEGRAQPHHQRPRRRAARHRRSA